MSIDKAKLKSPLVSVLIPAYNHEDYVQDTINSIVNQTFENIELCVVDDGSSDGTWAKILEMQDLATKRFANVVFETKANGGNCETLNLLLDKAQGDYIYLIASDDLAKADAIQTQIEFLENNPEYGFCVGDNELIDSDGITVFWDEERNIVYKQDEARYSTFCDFLKHMRGEANFENHNFGTYNTLYLGNYMPNGYLVRRSIFLKIGKYTQQAPLQDYWLMLQIAKYTKLKYINKVLFSYRWHASNTSKQKNLMEKLTAKTRNYENKILRLAQWSKLEESCILSMEHKKINSWLRVIKYTTPVYKNLKIKLFDITVFKVKLLKSKDVQSYFKQKTSAITNAICNFFIKKFFPQNIVSKFHMRKNNFFQAKIKRLSYGIYRHGNLDGTAMIAEHIITNNPNFAWAYFMLGKTQWRQCRFKQALQNVQKAIDLEPLTDYYKKYKESKVSELQ